MNATVFLAGNRESLTRAERAGANGWRVEASQPGWDVRCLVRDPHRPHRVYAGTQGHGVVGSDDRGQSWRPLGLDGAVVKSLAVSPHTPGTLYAGTKPAGVFVSLDRGRSWQELEGFHRARRWYWFSPAEPPFNAYVQAIAVSPTDPDVILAGIEAGAVVRSQDGGRTWSGHCPGADRDCHSMTFHATRGDWVYEGGGGGPAVSRDAGRTWHKPKTGLDRRYCWASAADPKRPEVWYVSASPMFSWPKFVPAAHVDGQANACIFRAAGGAAWQKLGGGLPQPLPYMAYALLTDPAAPGHLYAGLSNGDVWHTADYGDTWTQLPFNLGGIHRTMILL